MERDLTAAMPPNFPGLQPNLINALEEVLTHGKEFTVFEDVQVTPGSFHDSVTEVDLDGYRFVHFWLHAHHATNMAMDRISLEVVFTNSHMGASGLVNLEFPAGSSTQPVPIKATSGQPAGGYGGFIVRVPVVGPGARVIVINQGAETYQFSVYGYATR